MTDLISRAALLEHFRKQRNDFSTFGLGTKEAKNK